MGLGSTARKIQGLTDTAEELYGKLTEVLERVREIETAIDETKGRVGEIDARLERQSAILEAIAEEHGIALDEIVTEDEGEPIEAGEENGPTA